jgi:hypothetical protein
MRTFVSIVAVLLMVPLAMPRIQAQAQSAHTAPQAAIDAALQQHVAAETADREAILRVLGHPEVKAVAERAGLDLRRATSAVATLDGADLARVAAQAQQVDEALAGGQSRVVISTTLIIIVLLVIILIIVAVD